MRVIIVTRDTDGGARVSNGRVYNSARVTFVCNRFRITFVMVSETRAVPTHVADWPDPFSSIERINLVETKQTRPKHHHRATSVIREVLARTLNTFQIM